MNELDENYYRPSQDQIEKIVPVQISLTELQNKINQQSIEISNLNNEINPKTKMTEILLIIIFATQLIIFYKLNKRIMGAEAKLDELLASIGEVITLIENAFVGSGDLTEAEVDAKVNPILERLRAIVPEA